MAVPSRLFLLLCIPSGLGAQLAMHPGQRPFGFVPNAGQAASTALFTTTGGGFAVSLERDGIAIDRVRLTFVDANPNVKVVGEVPLRARVNYFLGKDPAKWKSNLATYSRVRYIDLWP